MEILFPSFIDPSETGVTSAGLLQKHLVIASLEIKVKEILDSAATNVEPDTLVIQAESFRRAVIICHRHIYTQSRFATEKTKY